ncbi:MAG: ATP-binding cassette domain-containing protein [Acholeplasmatales bacterium]|nr:ATP-binding cassette domain-containing protein [Acholeplasmatales bacterium]
MASLSLKHIYKVYDNGFKAVNDFCMDIEDKEFIVFVGPSGCGKSTTLRMIAGLEEITAGELTIDNVVVNHYAPKDRDIAMVFQSYALYPHMTVYDNIAYSLKINKVPCPVYDENEQLVLDEEGKPVIKYRMLTAREIDDRVQEAAVNLNITEYLDRKPKALSGGQRQRVALGRAIVRNPKVFLLDEPLSNLDAKLRASMRSEITKLHQKLQTTFIYVTHDQVEAMTMGSRIVVMKDGFVQQIDTPKNIYNYPANKFVAGFIGTPQMNFYNAVYQVVDGEVFLDMGFAKIRLLKDFLPKIKDQVIVTGKEVTIGIRPENIFLYENHMDLSKIDVLEAKTTVVEALGSETIVYANLDKDNDRGITDNSTEVRIKMLSNFDVKVGDVIKVAVDLTRIHLFDSETGESVVQRIPDVFSSDAVIEKDVLKIYGSEVKLPPSVKVLVKDGYVSVNVPTAAVELGGKYQGEIIKKDIVDAENLYWIKSENSIVFLKTPRDVELSGKVNFNINVAAMKLSGKDYIVHRINLLAKLPVTAILPNKELLQFKSNDDLFDVPFDMAQKLFNTKGRKLLKTKLSITFNTDNDGPLTFKARVLAIQDYGDYKYARVDYKGNTFYVVDQNYNIGQEIVVHLDLDEALITDEDYDMILCGTQPRRLQKIVNDSK